MSAIWTATYNGTVQRIHMKADRKPRMPVKNNRYIWLWLIPIFLLLAWIALPWLNRDIIWFDEYRSLWRAGAGRLPRISMFESIMRSVQSEWPPFYFLLLWAWERLIGTDTHFMHRSFQFFTSLIAISMMYRTAASIFNRRTGLIAAMLLASNVMFIFYVHELRPYVLWVLLITLCIYLYWRLQAQKTQERKLLWGLTLTVAATLYTHQLSPIFIGLLGIFHLLSWGRIDKTQWQKILWHFVLAALIYSPGLASMILSVLRETGVDRPVDRIALLEFSAFIYSNGLTILIGAALLASLRWIADRRLQYLWFLGGLTIITMLISDIWVKFFFHPRYLIAGLPALLMILAYIVNKVWERWAILAITFLVLWSVAGVIYHENGTVYDVPEDPSMNNSAISILTTNMNQIEYIADFCVAENDFMAFATNTSTEDDIWINPLSYYLLLETNASPNFGLVGNLLDIVAGPQIEIDDLVATTTSDERLDTMLTGHETVWLLHDPTIDIADDLQIFTEGLVARGYESCGEIIEETALLGTIWTQNPDTCEQLVTTCSP